MGASLPRTKIVATLGPACDDAGAVARMVGAGMSVARINFAHGAPPDHRRFVAHVRAAAKEAGRAVAVMADLAGPKIRVGDLEGGKVTLEAGRTVRLVLDDGPGTADRIPINEPRVFRDVRKRDPIVLADGTLELEAVRVGKEEVECKVVAGGLLLPRKGVNFPRTRLTLPSLTARDEEDLRRVPRLGVDAVALSFVRTAGDVERVRELLGRHRVPLIAKIERAQAVENLEAILDAADGVMVARGDLGVETSTEDVPHIQKEIIRRANDHAKPVITATQMLLSMVDQARPTRAEAADVANAIFDGTDAIMLSEETARGKHPVRVIETMVRIANRTEQDLHMTVVTAQAHREAWVAGAVSGAAVQVARQVGAKAIVTPTRGGSTPRAVARLRPPMPVLALADTEAAAQFLCLSWGVHPVRRRLPSFERTMRVAETELERSGLVRPGERYVLTAGYPPGHASNVMSVQTLGGPDADASTE